LKSISHLFPSKELECIAWLNIIHNFSFDDIRNIIIFPSEDKDNHISIISCSESESSDYKENNFIHLYGFKNTFKNRADVIIGYGIISIDEYELFKQDKIKCHYKFSDGIEIIREDIPDVYRLLQ
jgi:hypothetical protein